MEFRILGPLEVRDGERTLPVGGAKRRAVAALLLLHANRVVASDRLIDGIWGEEPPPAALASLQNHVLRLRRELGDRLVTRPPGYLLRVEPGELDLERFRGLVDEARGREPLEAASLLREALALWRGPPLADLAREPVAASAAHLGELRHEAIERRIDADLELGRHAELVTELDELVREQPLRERYRAQLLLALYRSGRQGDALEAYAAARATLVEELGANPGEELQALHRAILRHDPALDGPSAEAARAGAAVFEEARKHVAVLLADVAADVAGDPEARRERLRRVRSEVEAIAAAQGGTAGRTADDRVLVIFGVPRAHDDDALRAVHVACALRAAGLVSRAVVTTGEVITGDPARGQPLVSGEPLEEADRLRATAATGDVLLGERAWRLLRHAVVAEARCGAYAVREVVTDAEAVVRRLGTPLVGRDDELRELDAAFARVVRDARVRLVTVFGSPGMGKTRLARELVARLGPTATCLIGRTPPFDAPALAPLRDALAPVAGGSVATWAADVLAGEADGDAVAARIAAAVGEAPSTGPMEETAWAVRRLLETLARERPLVLVLEDLHWAAPAFLDLVEHVATLARAPILLLVLARPELLDSRPEWAGGSLNASSILLDALPADDAEALVDRLAADVALAPDRRTAILDAAAGNPLFLEQLLASALEDGGEAVPDSIHTLLAARLDRLGADERRVLEAAAVCGETFDADVVGALVAVDVRSALLALTRRDLVEPVAPGQGGVETWSFRHALVRDEAYAGIPKRRRASLHRQVAAIAADRAAAAGVDTDELTGYHLEAAYDALAEIEPSTPELADLASAAAARLERAGRRAHEERDMRTSAALLGRAVALLSPGASDRVALMLAFADALAWIDRREDALRILDEAERLRDPGDDHMDARLVVARQSTRLWGSTPEDPERVLADARRAIAVLEAAGDDEGLAGAHLLAYHAGYRRSSISAVHEVGMEEDLRRAVASARAAGSRHLEGLATSWLCVIVRRGRWPVEIAKREVAAILESPPSRLARAGALGGLADLRAMEGAFDEARALVAENHAIIEALGLPQTAAADLIAIADIEILAGDLVAAESILRDALPQLERLGDRWSTVNAGWRLALVLARLGRDDEAEAVLERTAGTEGGDYVRAWRGVVAATVAAHRGDGERVSRLLDESGALLESRGESGTSADALLQAGDALALVGRRDEAAVLVRRAAAIADRLEYVVAARAARERLASYSTETR